MKSKLIEQWNKAIESMKIEQAKVDNIKALEDWAIKFKAMTDVVLQAHEFARCLSAIKDYVPKHGKQIVGRGRPEQVVTVPVWKLDSMLEDIETLSCRNNHLKNALTDREKHIARLDSDYKKLMCDHSFMIFKEVVNIKPNSFEHLKEENIAMTERIDRLDAKLKKRTQSLKYYRELVNKGNKALHEANKDIAILKEQLTTQKMLRTIHNTPEGVKVSKDTVEIDMFFVDNIIRENTPSIVGNPDTMTIKLKNIRQPFCDK